MRFTFTEDQQMFRDSVRALLEKECPAEYVRASWDSENGHSPELWAKLAEIGLLGLVAPESHGGLGMAEVDSVLLFEETGRAALPEPVVETAAIAVPLLEELANAPLAEEWLPRIAAGEAIVTVGHQANAFVADAHVADLLLLPNGDEVHAVTADGVKLERQACHDPARRLFRVDWQPSNQTLVAKGATARAALDAALDRGALATAAQQLGIGQRMVDIAVLYATQREQFGKPIGSFQAIKHVLASTQVKIEFARPLVYRAAHSVAHGSDSRSTDASQAKATASEAAVQAAKTSLQVHGAIGYTWECDLHIWMKRAWSLDLAWGSAAWHRNRIGEALLDGAAPAPSFGYSHGRAS